MVRSSSKWKVMVIWRVAIILAAAVTLSKAANSPDCEKEAQKKKSEHLLSPKYKDIFVGLNGGRPTYGNTKATCWARGGVCVDLRECPMLQFDGSVGGCMYGFKVCCKSFQRLSPQVKGWRRRASESGMPLYSPSLNVLNHKIINNMGENNIELLKFIGDI